MEWNIELCGNRNHVWENMLPFSGWSWNMILFSLLWFSSNGKNYSSAWKYSEKNEFWNLFFDKTHSFHSTWKRHWSGVLSMNISNIFLLAVQQDTFFSCLLNETQHSIGLKRVVKPENTQLQMATVKHIVDTILTLFFFHSIYWLIDLKGEQWNSINI